MEHGGQGSRSSTNKAGVGEWSMVVKGTGHLLTSIVQPATFPLFIAVTLLYNQQHSIDSHFCLPLF